MIIRLRAHMMTKYIDKISFRNSKKLARNW